MLTGDNEERITIKKFISCEGEIKYELKWKTFSGIYLSEKETLKLAHNIIGLMLGNKYDNS